MQEFSQSVREVGHARAPQVPAVNSPAPQRKQAKRFRVRIFSFLASLTYGFFLFFLFWQERLLLSAGLFCVLFIELMFLAIDLRTVKKRWLWLALFLLGAGLWLFMPNPVWQLVVAMWISLFAI